MNTAMNSIVGTGLFALDVILRQDGTQSMPSLGGSAGNVLCILGALGWNATPVGVLGQDRAADKVWCDFDRVRADTRFLLRSEGRSTPVIYQHQLEQSLGSTHRFSFSCPVCGERKRPFWDEDDRLVGSRSELPSAGVFFLDRPTALGVTLAEHFAETGAVVVFEPSAFGDDVSLFNRAVRCSSVVKYSQDRIEAIDEITGCESTVEIQTLGADGLRFRVPTKDKEWTYLDAYDLPFIEDTSGAGDWCTAGLIFDLFKGNKFERSRLFDNESLTHSLVFGQALSSLNCLTEGARGLLSSASPDSIVQWAYELRDERLSPASSNESDFVCGGSESNFARLIDEFLSRELSKSSSGYRDYCCTTT